MDDDDDGVVFLQSEEEEEEEFTNSTWMQRTVADMSEVECFWRGRSSGHLKRR